MANLFLILRLCRYSTTRSTVALCPGSKFLTTFMANTLVQFTIIFCLDYFRLPASSGALPSYSFYPHSIRSILKCWQSMALLTSVTSISFRIQVQGPTRLELSTSTAGTLHPAMSLTLFPIHSHSSVLFFKY